MALVKGAGDGFAQIHRPHSLSAAASTTHGCVPPSLRIEAIAITGQVYLLIQLKKTK
jgi:hypothetical protein